MRLREPLSGIAVLVVEDDPLSREGLSLVLAHYGAEVQTAGNVADALAQLDTYLPTVLISDIGLPGEDGFHLIERIRAGASASPKRLPAIALSGFSDPGLASLARSVGFDAFLTKPVDIPVLVSVIEGLVGDQRTGL